MRHRVGESLPTSPEACFMHSKNQVETNLKVTVKVFVDFGVTRTSRLYLHAVGTQIKVCVARDGK